MAEEEPNIEKYKNSASQNLEAWKQIQKKEDVAYGKASAATFKKLGEELVKKNSYFSRSKRKDVAIFDDLNELEKTRSNYRQIKNVAEDDYCQKCPSYRNRCPHKNPKESAKDKYSYPIVTSFAYGWLEPYDDLTQNKNLNSVMKSFYDSGHLR